MSDEPKSTGPLLFAVISIVGGVLVAALGGGIGKGSILGAIVSALGAVPAGYAFWQGTQKQTQSTSLYGLLLLFLALGVGALLLILRFVAWLG